MKASIYDAATGLARDDKGRYVELWRPENIQELSQKRDMLAAWQTIVVAERAIAYAGVEAALYSPIASKAVLRAAVVRATTLTTEPGYLMCDLCTGYACDCEINVFALAKVAER